MNQGGQMDDFRLSFFVTAIWLAAGDYWGAGNGMGMQVPIFLVLIPGVLDASFALDGAIGAFSITTDVVINMLGLATGAVFVRSLTVSLVRKSTLVEYVFLEHGTHYAIGALAAIMLVGTLDGVHIPKVVTGLIGVAFIAFAWISYVRHNKKIRPVINFNINFEGY